MSGPGHAEGAQGGGARRRCVAEIQAVCQPAAVQDVMASASRLAVEVRLVLEATGGLKMPQQLCGPLLERPEHGPGRDAEQAWHLLLLKAR